MKQKIVFLMILTCVLAFARSERGYGFLMLEEPVNAKKISMGSVGTALGGDGFRYYNPAAPFFSARSYASIEFGQMPGGVNKGGFESAVIFPNWFTAAGLYSSSLDFETRDERGFGAEASSSTTIGSLGAGFIRERLAVGISAQIVQDRIWVSDTYNAFTLSAGAGYKLIDGKLNLGAAGFHGFAKSNGFGENASAWHDGLVPRFARAGAAWTDTVKTFPFTVAADIVYRDENATVSVPVGAEVQVLPYIALRIGKRFGWESEIFSLGIGLNIDKISFDAAFVPSVLVDDYELKWSMGLSYNLSGKRGVKSTRTEIFPEAHVKPREETEADGQEPVVVDEVIDTGINSDEELHEIEDEEQPPQKDADADGRESDTDEKITDIDNENHDEQGQPEEDVHIDKQESVTDDKVTDIGGKTPQPVNEPEASSPASPSGSGPAENERQKTD